MIELRKVSTVKAVGEEHFNSLIEDYREAGFMIVTYQERFAELEKGDEIIVIEF